MLITMPPQANWRQRARAALAAARAAALTAALLAASGAAPAANVSVNLCATRGTASMPGAAAPLPVLAYVAGSCPATASAPGGPVIDVNVGDTVTVTLQNALPEASGLLFQGQAMVPDTSGAGAATGAIYPSKSYTFVASKPGTFLYEAALLPNAEHQSAMGLHGALLVRPPRAVRTDTATVSAGASLVGDLAIGAGDIGASVSGSGIAAGTVITAVTPGTSFLMSAAATASASQVTLSAQRMAYGDNASRFGDEAVLVVSELDPALNGSADPASFDMRDYAPKYFLINGKAYPDTTDIASAAGNKLLLRYVNAGVKQHSMAVLGMRQNFLAKDGSVLPQLALNVAAESLAPGQTGDALITVPAATAASRYAVYDGSLMLHNNGVPNAFGGMLTFVSAGAGAADSAPAARAVALSPNPSNGSVAVVLSATLASSASTVTAAEYFIDSAGSAGSGLVMSGSFGSASVTASATLSLAQLAALPAGNHAIYVRGKDANGKWGAPGSATLNLDKAGPLVSGLTLTPNPSAGNLNVALHGTGDDSASGGAKLVQAEYFSGAPGANGMGTQMTINIAAPIASLDAVLMPPLSSGTLSVHAKDELGNWGPFATIALNIVAGGPSTTAVSATPNPNNGEKALSASQPVVRVSATLSSTGSTVSAAEGFIDTVPASPNGKGFAFIASDGAWNGVSEVAYADIPLGSVKALSNGPHTIYVHGKDKAGNWGAMGSTVLTVDKAAPVIAAIALSSGGNPLVGGTIAFGTASVTMTLTTSDNASGVVAGQYWIDGSATPPPSAIAFNGASATISSAALAAGSHTLYVRVQDGATNWSAVSSVTLLVVRAVNDSLTVTPNNNASQVVVVQSGVLANDLPNAVAARTAVLTAAPVRIGGNGAGTLSISCPAGTGNVAGPALGGNAICTNGAYAVTLTGVGNSAAARRTSKVGSYRFSYVENLNGVSSPATVTITVN